MIDQDLDTAPGATTLPTTGATATDAGAARTDSWWRNAVIYEIYPRSFADADGDGTGDLAGVRSRLPYLRDLGVDAIWFTPWYVSPLADGGYDVADYRAIDPVFGSLEEAELLIAEARELGIRTIVDIVPNHVSDRHAWFQAALAAGPGSPERERFWFRPGGGADGSELPTDWVSSFAGDTWTRTTNPDGTPGEWYLHLFAKEQPDLNWDHPDVRREHEDILRFWFDRGVAGIRIDSAAFLVKDPELPSIATAKPGAHPHLDRDELHDIYRAWRAIADSYPEQQARFHAALGVGHITQHRIDDPTEVEIFLRLSARGRLGAGERSAIAVALNRGCALAIDDSRAIRRAIEEAGIAGNPLTVLRTQDVIVHLIRAKLLEIEAADAIKENWHLNHRFTIRVGSFAELL